MNPAVPRRLFHFNRPMPTLRVFEEIARLKPAILLITADGPRHEADVPLCEACKQIVADINWPCDVRRNYSDTNLGVRRRMFTGIDWVFSQFEQAILLEDDCVPHPTFFRFCTDLLDHYKNDDRIMMISGDNMLPGKRWNDDSYYFSVMTHIWGWATWRRAWKHYNAQMPDWPDDVAAGFPGDFVPSPNAARFYSKMMDDTYTGNLNAWGLAWMYAAWKRRGLSIAPAVILFLTSDLGPMQRTRARADPFAELPIEAMQFPLVHPQTVTANTQADMAFFKAAVVGEYKNWRG